MATHLIPEKRRARICAWLRRNEIDPDVLPEDSGFSIRWAASGQVIDYEVYEFDDSGAVTGRSSRRSPLLVPLYDYFGEEEESSSK